MTLFELHQLPCLLESRLSNRYQTIVMEHMTVNSTNAPGAKSLEHHTQYWASTQATWRFYHNDNVTFPMLSSPMLRLARAGVKETQSRYVLMAHDWCRLNFSKHQSKFDKTQMSHALEIWLKAPLDTSKQTQLDELKTQLSDLDATWKERQRFDDDGFDVAIKPKSAFEMWLF